MQTRFQNCLIKTKLIENERRLSRRLKSYFLISRSLYDPNESSAVYLLTSYDEYAVCGTNLLPNQLLCRKYLATKFFFVEETFDHVPGNEKDQVSPICRYWTNLGDFRHRRTMILKVYINGHKTGENRGKELNNV